ncbi:MAG: ATP-binding cassette domain-containing protein [Bacteroidales bacterium]
MSQQILRALMQLFAIIARPESNTPDRRAVVASYLNRHLNRQLVAEYLKVFDENYNKYQQKLREKDKGEKRTSSLSVRVLVICTRINEELNRRQKVIVLVNLLEFVKSDNDIISSQEFEFISTVAETFNISGTEFRQISDFVLTAFDTLPDNRKTLIIGNNSDITISGTRHIYRELIEGQVRVFKVTFVNMYLARYIGLSEVYLNSQLMQQDKVYVFDNGTSLRNPAIKPVYFSDIVSSFSPHLIESGIIFSANNIGYRFRDGKPGLRNITFAEESGRLIGIMGSSGSGKSTLLNVLNGSRKPGKGQVLINGIDIYSNKDKVEGLIGHVSQDDLLIEELTVYQNLYYNAKLCFANYTSEQVADTVGRMLKQLGLFEIKDIQVGDQLNNKISGGQRKRLNIALELIREPAILFLDEPTSGLSSRDSENILDLLKELSLKGKLVFVVIHQPSSDIYKMFDKLLILDTGGYLIYAGDPVEAISYFKSCSGHANWNESECHNCGNVNSEQIFNIIEANLPDEFGKQTKIRKVSPFEWARLQSRSNPQDRKQNLKHGPLPAKSFKIPGRYRQFIVFAKRDILSKLSDRQYLLINFLEAPVLAFLLAFIIKYHDVNSANPDGYTFAGNVNLPVYLFISVIVAIFTGLTISAEEIIKDRKILKRESFLNLSWSGYLMSKIFVLFIISAIQAMSFVVVGNYIMEVQGMYFHYWIVLFSAWCFSVVLGLIVSDSFRTVITVYILIPFLVIPQLILSGVIVKFENMNPSVSHPDRIPLYGEIITARWAYEALAVWQFTRNRFEKKFYHLNKQMSRAEYMNNYWIPDVQNKLAYSGRNLDNKLLSESVAGKLNLVENELNDQSGFSLHLNSEEATTDYIEKAADYLEDLKLYYQSSYNKASHQKDSIISWYNRTGESTEYFIELKNRYHNEALSDLVRNSKTTNRIVEYNNRLYQKADPVYRDPQNKFIKAQFYSPSKSIFGITLHTMWVNLFIIWVMTLFLYVLLYFRVLRKVIDYIGEIISGLRARVNPENISDN